ncbi:TPA: hypothetical protein MEA26_004504 [Klebsiella aerogenes]|nr:hypothetical protein [Klebsiella aerogenes]
MKQNLIDVYRRRIAIATLGRMKRKTGGYCLIVNMPDGEIKSVELNEEAMTKLLMKFEAQAKNEFGHDADKFLRQTYMNCLDINGHTEYLTEQGKMIMDELLSDVVTYLKKNTTNGDI